MSTVYNDPIMLDSTGQDIVTKLDSIASLMGDGVIDDTSTATDTTWSSNKITSELAGKQDELTFDHTPKDDSLNPVYSDGIYDSIIGVYDNLELGLGWDSKNILGIANTSKEVNGITFTVNDNGTVKLNGTATSATLYALNKFTGAELKKYGENLLMTGGKDNSTFLTLMTQDWAYTKDDKGNGVEINISELTDATEYTVIIQIANGTTLSNYVMSPMIRLASVIDPSFKKHHDSANKTIDVKSLGYIKDTVGWNGKNICPYPKGTRQVILSDGSIQDNSDMYLSDYVSVDGISKLRISVGSVTGSSIAFRIATFDTSKTFIERLSVAPTASTPIIQTLDSTVKYVRFCFEDNSSIASYTQQMVIDNNILDDTYEPYHENVVNTLREAEVIQGKNLLENTATNTTNNGITFTVNTDGTVKVNGTATADTYFTINHPKLSNGNYILNGCPSGGNNSNTYNIFCSISGTATVKGIDTGNGVDFSITEDADYVVIIKIFNGYVANNIIFKPMLRYATETNSTYEPCYIPLKDSKISWADASKSVQKNVLKNTAVSGSLNNVTWTVNADKTVRVVTGSGGASANTQIVIPFDLDGNYIMNGSPAGGENGTKYDIFAWDTTTNARVKDKNGNVAPVDDGNGTQISPVKGHDSKLVIEVKPAAGQVDLLFKPMIRNESIADSTYEPFIPNNTELVDWASYARTGVHNLYNLKKTYAIGENTELAFTDTGFRVYNTVAGNYKASRLDFSNTIIKNGDICVLSADVTITSGSGRLTVRGAANNILAETVATSSGHYELRFTKTSEMVYVSCFCTYEDNTEGDVTYNNVVLKYAEDAYDGFTDYAMTNGELTENLNDLAQYRGHSSFYNDGVTKITIASDFGTISAGTVFLLFIRHYTSATTFIIREVYVNFYMDGTLKSGITMLHDDNSLPAITKVEQTNAGLEITFSDAVYASATAIRLT